MTYKVALHSLGCSKNLIDSEMMLGWLKDNRYEIIKEFSRADVLIINTCGFILPAKEESIASILSLARYKKTGRCKVLVATGCLVQKYGNELMKEIPELDAVLGTNDFQNIVHIINTRLGIHVVPSFQENIYENRYLTTPSYTAYVKIAEGCNNRCTFCLIPQLRGKYQSRTIESIAGEVKVLAARGVKEINLVAQDTTYYGKDLYGEEKLSELLDRVARENIEWIRVLYCYPLRVSEKLLEVMAKHPNICHYLDIPIQHADDRVLKGMGRKENREYLVRLIQAVRNIIPDITLRTTCMVGFPGETEEQFQFLLNFVEEMRFNWLGAFTYFPEEDTPAASLPGQIPKEVKEERYRRLMTLQSQISQKENEKWIGKTNYVLVEGKSSDNPEYFIGRSKYQAPEVDGIVFIKANSLKVGDIVPVHITGSDIYDLIGEIEKK